MLRNGEDAKWANQRAAPSEVDLKQGLRGPSGEAEGARISSCRRRPQRRVSDAAPRRTDPRHAALHCATLHFRLQEEEEEEEKEEENLGRVIKTSFLFLNVYKEFILMKNILYKSFKETHKETQDDLLQK